MQGIQFDVIDWMALSPGISQPEQWADWQANGYAWPDNEHFVPSDAIPPMQKRRMSTLSRLAVQVAVSLTREQSVDYIVFSCRHGELTRTSQLLQSVLDGQPASPMAFSQSVHNTATGLFTIIAGQTVAATSVSASRSSLHAACIEAAAYLASNPTHRVLLVDFDEPLPDPYGQYETQDFRGYALGLLLTSGQEFLIQGQRQSNRHVGCQIDSPDCSPLPQGLMLVDALVSKARRWTMREPRYCWHWQRART